MPADEPLRLYAAVPFGWAEDTHMVSMGVMGMTQIWVQVTEVPMEHASVPGDEAPLHDTWVVSCVMIRNHAYQKLFPFIVTRPSSLLSLSPLYICDQHVVKLHIPELFPFL
jgi:hypothetical protein